MGGFPTDVTLSDRRQLNSIEPYRSFPLVSPSFHEIRYEIRGVWTGKDGFCGDPEYLFRRKKRLGSNSLKETKF